MLLTNIFRSFFLIDIIDNNIKYLETYHRYMLYKSNLKYHKLYNFIKALTFEIKYTYISKF